MANVILKSLTKKFKEVTAVDNVNIVWLWEDHNIAGNCRLRGSNLRGDIYW